MRIHKWEGARDDVITMAEIARLTRVSQPTVSRVLNGNMAVDPAIRERVLACAREHDYQFNALAKSLQGSKTNLLGVIFNDMSNSFFADLAKVIEGKAREHGYSIILFNSDHDPQRQREYMDIVRRYRVDGVLITPTLRDMAAWREGVGRLDIPAVVVTRQVEELDSIYLDHEEAARQVARHLAERGYDRFLFVGKKSDSKFQGFSGELEGMGQAGEPDCFEEADDGAFRNRLEGCLRPGSRLGIFANNDLWALKTLRALRELKVPVPEEAGVIGFDDISIGRYFYPSLSSVSQPITEMADEAVSRLIHRIGHPDEAQRLDLPMRATLVPREST